ncbi:MAG: hypothetical protein PVF66_05715 [Candidatus Aminicenantes bacterium]
MKVSSHSSICRLIFLVLMSCFLTTGFTGEQAQTIDKKKIQNEQYRIKKQLHPSTQPKIAQAVQSFKENYLSLGEESNPTFIASQVARDQFRAVSPFQKDLLGFYVLCLATTDLEGDIGLITAEIEKMNRAKEELNRIITSMEEQIEEKTKEETQESEEEQAEEEETPVLKEYESLETAPHFKAEYPKSPEIIFSKELEKMSLPQLNNDLYYIKTALNSVHEVSKTAVEALRKEMERRDNFLLELFYLSELISNIEDSEIKSIR